MQAVIKVDEKFARAMSRPNFDCMLPNASSNTIDDPFLEHLA